MSTVTDGSAQARREGVAFAQLVGSILLAAVLVIYAVHGSMSRNALRLPFENRVDTVVFAPEGWGFFTRDPREPLFLVFGQRDDGTWSQLFGEKTELRTTFAFSRYVRSLYVEAGMISTHVRPTDWQQCSTEPSLCLGGLTGDVKSISSETPSPVICGNVALVQQERLPWAWAKSVSQRTMPSKTVRFNVKCTPTR